MTCSKFLRAAATLAWLALPQAGWSVFDPVNDDTDIFLANPAFTATRPNVLIVVDNSGNWGQNTGLASPWNTKYDGVKNALVAVSRDDTIINANYNVGLALYAETSGDNSNTGGGYIRYGIRQMSGDPGIVTTNRGRFRQLVSALDKSVGTGDGTNNTDYSLAMYEFYQYFAGLSSFAGHGKGKTDAGDSVYVTGLGRQSLAGSPLPSGADVKTSAPMTYTSPIVDGCQKNFLIIISNGNGTDPNSELSDAQSKLASVTGTATPSQIPLTPGFEQGIWSDEFAKFMANSDCNASFAGVQNVITYTIDIIPDAGGHGPDHTALLKSMAINGKGKYYAVTDTSSTGQLQGFLKDIFQEVQAVNSVFASTTLPVSVNVRGTNLNQVYIGVFRPDPNKSPRWLGNLKLYKLGVDTATQNLFIADATGAPAENAATGFISGNATSYWTSDSGNFWSFLPAGVGGAKDIPDGDLVEKGGAAQRLRVAYPGPLVASPDHTARKLYTCLDTTAAGACATTGLSSTPFDSSNVTAGDVGAYTTKPVVTLTSTGTTARATVTAHGWGEGNTVRITGATPTNYNLTKPIHVIDANTFEYQLDVAPDVTRARVTATGHGLADNDVVYLIDNTAYPLGYTGLFVPITRVSADQFDYTPAVPQTTPLSYPSFYAYGGRIPVFAVGVIGSSKMIISLPGHGFTGTLPGSYLYPPNFAYDWSLAYGDMSVIDANTLEIPTYYSQPWSGGWPEPITAPADIALITTQIDHGFSSLQTVQITGSTVGAYNGSHVITQIDRNRFFFTSSETTPDSSTINPRTIRAGHAIASITRSGNTATVTTTTAHGLALSQSVQIFDTGSSCYDGTRTVGSVSSNGLSFTMPTAGGCPNITSATQPNMFVGTGVNSIEPARVKYSNMAVLRSLTTTSLVSPLTSASGVMLAGRPGPSTPNDIDAALGALIVNWVLSADNTNPDENGNGQSNDVRSSVHGDVLHSRPATINYNRLLTLITGTDDDSTTMRDSDVYAFYGSNDGILHAVKGGILQHTPKPPNGLTGPTLPVTVGPDANIAAGTERWGFVPQEFFPKLKRLRDQTPTISNITQKDYFFDGSIGVYQKDVKGNGDATLPLNCVPGSCGGADTVSGVLGDNIHPTLGDKVHLYLSLRRGGNFIYALNVLNPAAPKLLWRRGCPSLETDPGLKEANGCDLGWGQLGQTWSEPKIAKVAANLGNASNPDKVVLIFGGGYEDSVEDVNPCLIAEWYSEAGTVTPGDPLDVPRIVQKAIGSGTVTYTAAGSCTISNATPGTEKTFKRTVGGALMVVDAFNGNVVWQASAGVATSGIGLADGSQRKLKVAGMTCAIPSDVTVLDKPTRDGLADRLYTGDTCGNVWRADIADPNMDKWKVTRIATLSGSGATTLTNKLKFLFPPDLVFGSDASAYTAVLLGSGDREHPFDATVQNAFYMIKDRDDTSDVSRITGAPNNTTVSIGAPSPNTLLSPPTAPSGMFDATNAVVDNSVSSSDKGWFISLRAGEKVVGSAVTIAGTTFFNTNQPSSTAGGGACSSNLGVAREYLVGFADAAATVDLQGLGTLSIANRSTIHAGGGYLPSPVPVVVEIDGKKYQAVISGTSVQTPPGLTLEKRTRAFWYKQID